MFHLGVYLVGVGSVAGPDVADALDDVVLVGVVALDVLAGDDVVPRLDNRGLVERLDFAEQAGPRHGDAGLDGGLVEELSVVDPAERLEVGDDEVHVLLELVAVLREDVAVFRPRRDDGLHVRSGGDTDEGVFVGHEVVFRRGDADEFVAEARRGRRRVVVFGGHDRVDAPLAERPDAGVVARWNEYRFSGVRAFGHA